MYTVTTGGTGQAQDANQTINALQRSAGQLEAGNYYIQAAGYAVNARVSGYMRSTSQGVTPASIQIDSAISNINLVGPTVDQLTQFGFHVNGTAAVANVNQTCAGNFWTQY